MDKQEKPQARYAPGAGVWLVLGVLILFHVIINGITLSFDEGYPVYDGCNFFERAVSIAHSLETGIYSNDELHTVSDPPLVDTVYGLMVCLAGYNLDAIACSNALFMILLVYGLYHLCRRLINRRAGIIACVLCLAAPGLVGHSRILWHEYALTAFVVVSFTFLLRTEQFTRIPFVVAFCLATAAGCLTRITFPLYVFVPFLVYVVYSLVSCRGRRYKQLMLMAGAIGGVVLMIGWWYYPSFLHTVSRYKTFFVAKQTETFRQMVFQVLYYYSNRNLFVPLTLVAILSLPFFFYAAWAQFEKKMVLLMIIIPIFAMFVFPLQSGFASSRWLLPTVPFIIISIVQMIEKIKTKRIRVVVYSFLIGCVYLQFAFCQFGYANVFRSDFVRQALDKNKSLSMVYEPEQGKLYARHDPYQSRAIVRLIEERRRNPSGRILFLADVSNLLSYMHYSNITGQPALEINEPLGPLKEFPADTGTYDIDENFSDVEFVVYLKNWEKISSDVQQYYSTDLIPYMLKRFKSEMKHYNTLVEIKGELGTTIVIAQKTVDD